MCGEMMIGTCEVCGKKDVPLQRKTFHYDVQCECHSPNHFEAINHCADCNPKEPEYTRIQFKTSQLKRIRELKEAIRHYEGQECLMKTAYDNDGNPYMLEAEGSEAKHIIELLEAEERGRLVEVVYCEECNFAKHPMPDEIFYCELLERHRHKGQYCSGGRRRKELEDES